MGSNYQTLALKVRKMLEKCLVFTTSKFSLFCTRETVGLWSSMMMLNHL